MPETSRFAWLFFGFRGRIGRKLYFLSGLFLLFVQFAVLFRIMAGAEAGGGAASGFWELVFVFVALIAVFANIALAAKRIQDFDKPGLIGVLFVIGGFLMYVVLCLVPGTPGPNRYGQSSDAPA